MLPKKGIVLPNAEVSRPVPCGPSPMLCGTSWALPIRPSKPSPDGLGAGERTVKNWLAGVSGPSGQHRVGLIRHSDDVLDTFLLLAGRQQIATTKKLVDARNKLAETVRQIDELMDEVSRAQ